MRKIFFPSLFILPLWLYPAGSQGTVPEPIRLLTGKIPVTPTEFYIHSVTDSRADQSAVANLFFAGAGRKPVIQTADLQGGADAAIRSFMFRSINRDLSLRPLHVQIKECKITEEISGDNLINGRITVALGFDLVKEGGNNVQLTQYSSVAKYSRTLQSQGIIEPTLRQLLANSLKFINSWMDKEVSENVKLARGVKIAFTDFQEQDTDTVYYQQDRPLIWNDFRDKPRNSRYSAQVFPGLGYDQRSKITDGIIHLELAIKVYVIKSASWVIPGSQDTYRLNHEQRHFDIVKLVGERFKEKLLSEKLTPDNYEGIINYEYLESFREMNQRQKEYDKATGHGSNQGMQYHWNKKIDNELMSYRLKY